VISLPPKERACVLLKDVFDHSLEEIAELVESTVGGVKAALHRGRSKIKASPVPTKLTPVENPELTQLLGLYVERFNRRDWSGVRELISADARLDVVGRFAGTVTNSPYFTRYEEAPLPLRLEVSQIDGEPVAIVFERAADAWTPRSPIRFEVRNHRVERITDYYFCPWILHAAKTATPAAS